MELKYILLLTGILLIGSVAAYTAASSDYVALTLDETANYVADSSSYVTLTLQIGAEDTCTYGGSGDWVVDCNDNCTITSDVEMGSETIVLAGTGTFTILADITADTLAKTTTCTLINTPGDGHELRIT